TLRFETHLIHKCAPPGTGIVSLGLDAIRPSARSADGLACPGIRQRPIFVPSQLALASLSAYV
ncbi:unnamed protein product, partial [Mycena citricolor]